RASARDRIDDHLRTYRPSDTPAGVAPILGEPVEDDDGIAVDVLDVPRGALDGKAVALRRPNVMRIELVEQERAVELARNLHPPGELRSTHVFAGRITRVR